MTKKGWANYEVVYVPWSEKCLTVKARTEEEAIRKAMDLDHICEIEHVERLK